MNSEDEDMDYDMPEEVKKGFSSNTAALPTLSKLKYDKVYDDFQKWNKLHGATTVTENVLINYFSELAQKNKPSTLWAYYSMIKATLRLNDNIDINLWSNLLGFLKNKSTGYKPIKWSMFTEQEINKFLDEAPDEQWLDVKVVCIFGVHNFHSSNKLVNVMIDHIKQYEDLILVTIPKTETSAKRSFTLTGTFFNIVQKYIALRPANVNINRFFLHISDGKGTTTPIGRNKFYKMPRRIAKYLNLPNPERYAGLSFRINSIAANNCGTSNLSNFAEQHNDEQCNEYSLDYETGLLKTSPVSNSSLFVSVAASNDSENRNAEHECTISCGRVECAAKENEQSALHAFSIFKPMDYDIIDVTAVLFASDPICRWIVAYTHNTEPVSFYNADETFKAITRSKPHNVSVAQVYIRGYSSQLLPAYVVVYGVNCRCQSQETSDKFSFSVNEIKYET